MLVHIYSLKENILLVSFHCYIYMFPGSMGLCINKLKIFTTYTKYTVSI